MSQFDVEGKPPAWHTAFYYLAEHVRFVTDGTMNHKMLYALVGTEGRYLNHANPTVRKRTAGALSRLVHSRGYADDMQSQYEQDQSTFARAASVACQLMSQAQRWDDGLLADYLYRRCWPDVLQGLMNEQLEWRGDLSLARVKIEMSALFASVGVGQPGGSGAGGAAAVDPGLLQTGESSLAASEIIFATVLHLLAFGNLNSAFARDLVDQYPTDVTPKSGTVGLLSYDACLVKYVDRDHSTLAGTWTVYANKPFVIGRYTDCDIVETNPRVSRKHCCVYCLDDTWRFEDCHSRNGSRVEREGTVVYDSKRDGAGLAVELQHGDAIVLANCSYYWFGAMAATTSFRPVP